MIDHEDGFTLIEKKSQFIAQVFAVSSAMEVKERLAAVKKKHYDARHNCYAYVLKNGEEKSGDDGEPQGTAGAPILEAIRAARVADALVVVTRYFGGILLGANGLYRAYGKSASEALKAAGKRSMMLANVYQIDCSYAIWEKLKAYFEMAGVFVKDIEFSETVRADLYVIADDVQVLQKVRDLSSSSISLKWLHKKEIII